MGPPPGLLRAVSQLWLLAVCCSTVGARWASQEVGNGALVPGARSVAAGPSVNLSESALSDAYNRAVNMTGASLIEFPETYAAATSTLHDPISTSIPHMVRGMAKLPKFVYVLAAAVVLMFAYTVLHIGSRPLICLGEARSKPSALERSSLSATVVANHRDVYIASKSLGGPTSRRRLELPYKSAWASHSRVKLHEAQHLGYLARLEVVTQDGDVVGVAEVPLPAFRGGRRATLWVPAGAKHCEDYLHLTLGFSMCGGDAKRSGDDDGGSGEQGGSAEECDTWSPLADGTLVVSAVTGTGPAPGSKAREGGPDAKSYVIAALFFLLYNVFGTLFFSFVEGWSYGDSWYFTVSTLLTVGYGDFVPTSPISKAVTAFISVLGVLYLGSVACLANTDIILNALSFQRAGVQLPSTQDRLKGIARVVLLELIFLLLVMVPLAKVEKLELPEAAFFLIVTSTTAGYGDVVAKTSLGRAIVAGYLVLECFVVGSVMTQIADWYIHRRAANHPLHRSDPLNQILRSPRFETVEDLLENLKLSGVIDEKLMDELQLPCLPAGSISAEKKRARGRGAAGTKR